MAPRPLLDDTSDRVAYSARAARPEDADAVEQLVKESTLADVGMAALRAGELRARWGEEEAAARDTVVHDPAGRIAAVLLMDDDSDSSSLYFEVYVAVENRGDDLEDDLVGRAETYAAQRARALGAPVELTTNVNTDAMQDLLGHHGYRVGMRDHAMFIALDAIQSMPRWPRGVFLRAYAEGDDDLLLYDTMRAGFGSDWPPQSDARSWIRSHRNAPGYRPDLWFFAATKDAVVGAVQCREQWRGQLDTG